MKKQILLIGIAALIMSLTMRAQGIYNAGAKIVVQSGANIVTQGSYINASDGANHGAIDLDGKVYLNGDYVNNADSGCGFTNLGTNGELILNGSSVQTLLGSSSAQIELEKLTLNNGASLNSGSKSVLVHGDLTFSSNAYQITIGSADFELQSAIIGAGLFNVINSGKLVRMPVQHTPLIFPIGDGTNNSTATVTCENAPSQKISVRINNDKSVSGAILSNIDYIDISGETNLNAQLKLRIDKAAINPVSIGSNNIVRYYNGSRYVPIPQDRVSIADLGAYYELTITGMNGF